MEVIVKIWGMLSKYECVYNIYIYIPTLGRPFCAAFKINIW